MQIRILVVDDQQDICDLLRIQLSREGYEVTATTEPLKVMDLLREAADYRRDSCDHKSMWVIRNVTRLLAEIAALERAFGLDR